MIFDILLYASLTICFLGIGYRIIFWTKNSVGYHPADSTQRRSDLIKGVLATIFSLTIFKLIKSLMLDVLLQGKILKTSLLRWMMHLLIFFGFTGLVFMHAMDALITEKLFSGYYSTINPFFFLRSFLGIMVIAGIAIALYRRYILTPSRLKSSGSDLFAILLVLAIILSGVALEGMKMASISEFKTMVEEYAGLDYEDEEVLALEAYWTKEFALVSPRISPPIQESTLSLGIESHETNCMDCHSPNKSGFLGYTAAKLLSPAAVFLDKMNAVNIFYYLHILLCFIALALVPFCKMFHIIATPISLLANAVQEKTPISFANQRTKELMELDACTHCGTCNLNCSAGMIYESVQNNYILPSEKMLALKKTTNGQDLNSQEFEALFQGLYLCTNCDRCTVVCPSGIQLKSLWLSAREKLIRQRSKKPFILTGFSFIRGLNKPHIEKQAYDRPLNKIFERVIQISNSTETIVLDEPISRSKDLSGLPQISRMSTDTFSHCFGCQNCSTICPVVAEFDLPEKELTLLPHQIMYSLGLNLVALAKGSAMIWNCLSCYQCQENCPQNVSVCDILFALKNEAFNPHQDTLI